jgi:tRNA(Ile)-lysidine synthase
MDDFLEQIDSMAPRNRGRNYLVGVSGGRDSVVLLHALVELGFRRLIICHLDHGLRGRDSLNDRRFVQRLARRLGLECICRKVDVAELSSERKLSIETAAREARHGFFTDVATSKRCSRVFLAHHADDVVETFLFNLCRGASRAGLTSMRTKSHVGKLTLLRPMLSVTRATIDTFASAHRIRFREDASNEDPRFVRNRLRQEAIPLLEEILGRDVRTAILRTVTIMRDEEDWIATLPEVTPSEVLSTREVAAMPCALQRRLLKNWLDQAGIRDVGFEEVERVRTLLNMQVAKVNLPGGRHARRRSGVLFLE